MAYFMDCFHLSLKASRALFLAGNSFSLSFLTWKIFIISCGGGMISLLHSVTPSLLHSFAPLFLCSFTSC